MKCKQVRYDAQYWTDYLINKGIVHAKDRHEVKTAFYCYMEWIMNGEIKSVT